jgi:hypothetical protein
MTTLQKLFNKWYIKVAIGRVGLESDLGSSLASGLNGSSQISLTKEIIGHGSGLSQPGPVRVKHYRFFGFRVILVGPD